MRLTEDQVRALGEFYPDDQLRGLKLHPYAITDRDEIGAFMAQALSCIYRGHSRQSPDGDIVRVYVDDSVDVPKRLVEMNAKAPDIVWFMSRQINYCNQIQLVPTPKARIGPCPQASGKPAPQRTCARCGWRPAASRMPAW